ncbi:MAG TPA: ABC transporter substrate-binding protein [Nocardioidaceae bacterium]|nr:ABC transporter substrate-binding protein [Nocardioidaceae bacterium]
MRDGREKIAPTRKGRSRMRFTRAVAAVSVLGMLALAGCDGTTGSDPQETPGIDTERLGASGAGMDAEREGPVEVEDAVQGGTVQVLSSEGLNTMDPTEAYYADTLSILRGLVTRSLTQYVYDEETGDMVLVPDLATDLGRHNRDYTEWTFTIREGVKWENGDEVTAEDVRYGILRSFDRAMFPQGAAYSNDYFLDGDTYRGPYKSGTDYPGVEVDGMTLTLKMRKPFPDMPYWGAFPAMGPIPEGNDQPGVYRSHPWSTGPYMFDRYTPEKSLTLVRNPHWDPNTDPGRTQYPEQYVFDFQTDATKIDQILLADQGEGEYTLTYDNILAADYRAFRARAADRLKLGPMPLTSYWAPDYRQITDKRVRQALAYAYPYRDAALAGGFIEGVTRIFGTNLMPPGVPGRTEYNPLPDHEPGTTDPARAKALLEKAGALGFEVRFLYAADDQTQVRTKDVVTRALEQAGFTASPVATTTADMSTERAKPDNDKINLRQGGWLSDWPSGGSWFPPMLQTTDLSEEGLGSNYAAFSEEDVDRRIEEVLRLPVGEQPAAWNELDEYIATEYFPLIVLGYGGTAQAHGSRIVGHAVDPTSGMPTWKNIWVEP